MVAQQQLDLESQRLIFPGRDRILALAKPDVRNFTAEISSAGWLLNEDYTGKYAEVLGAHFEKIQNAPDKPVATATIIHRVDAVFTILWKVKRQETL